MEELFLVLIGALATASFAVLFQMRPKFLPMAFIGGGLTFGTFILLDYFGLSLFVSNFAAAFVSVIFANVMSRVLKVPATVFITCCIMSLVPGGALFSTLKNVILGSNTLALQDGKKALEIALGIAGGIAVETSVWHLNDKIKKAKAKRKIKKT